MYVHTVFLRRKRESCSPILCGFLRPQHYPRIWAWRDHAPCLAYYSYLLAEDNKGVMLFSISSSPVLVPLHIYSPLRKYPPHHFLFLLMVMCPEGSICLSGERGVKWVVGGELDGYCLSRMLWGFMNIANTIIVLSQGESPYNKHKALIRIWYSLPNHNMVNIQMRNKEFRNTCIQN